MAIPGQLFELDLDADNFTFNTIGDTNLSESSQPSIIKEIQEHDPTDIPAAPKIKQTKSGFPEHKARRNGSAFRQQREKSRNQSIDSQNVRQVQPSDAAIRHRVANKYGYEPTSDEKAKISEENEQRIAAMSEEDIEEARAELMQTLNPTLIERFLKRANIDKDHDISSSSPRRDHDADRGTSTKPEQKDSSASEIPEQRPSADDEEAAQAAATTSNRQETSIHFPVPPRDRSNYKPLDPNSDTFLTDLRTTYFPELTHSPSSLDWLQPDSDTTPESHSYAPDLVSYPASSIRFNFAGNIIPPSESQAIPVSEGLHHHGSAPNAAGYTIPELTLLARSTLPGQRCIAYQITGRILYRLGKGEFGEPGSDLNEALWAVIEEERILELMMAEANRQSGHASAKAYATEALWLWRKGGGGARGLKKGSERRAN